MTSVEQYVIARPRESAEPCVERDPLWTVTTWLSEHGFAGRGRMFRCPGHNDTEPSLCVSRGTKSANAAVVLHCFAGCAVADILKAMTAIDPSRRWAIGDLCWETRPGGRAPLPDLSALEAAHRRGEVMPVPVGLGDLPEDATENMRRIRDDFALVRGLYEAAGEYRPTPYSARFCGQRVGLDKMRANAAIRALVSAGVITSVGQLQRRAGQPRGTGTYLPGLVAGLDSTTTVSAGNPASGSVEVANQQPVTELANEEKVHPAEAILRGRNDIPAGAARNRASATIENVADSAFLHETNHRALRGVFTREEFAPEAEWLDWLTARHGPPGRNQSGALMPF